ncbi:ANTAR domain-containing protein [Streptomyces sp. NPDC060205]|uniref:ANTAR domain-containing protein n=1 Tax=Streptomyces sp. NPDC060205 TaxID=3347072 RepID=UPI003668C180
MRPSQRPGPRRDLAERLPHGAQRDTSRDLGCTEGRMPTGEQLLAETEQLRKALERRPIVDMARGVLMAAWSCTAEEAWQILVHVSQHSNIKVHDVAKALIATTQNEPLPAPIEEHLLQALARWRSSRDG